MKTIKLKKDRIFDEKLYRKGEWVRLADCDADSIVQDGGAEHVQGGDSAKAVAL